MMIKVKKCVLGRPVVKTAIQIKTPQSLKIDVGYGVGQLRPDGARDPRAEDRVLSKIIMRINGMSGQLAS